MDGPFHYSEAERLLGALSKVVLQNDGSSPEATLMLTEAQVHATLALAAATALNAPLHDNTPTPDEMAWYEVSGVKPEPSSEPGQVEPEPGDGTVSISGVAPKSIVVYSGWNDGNPVVIDSVEDLGGVVCVHYRDAKKPRYSKLPATVPSDTQVTPYGGTE